MLLGNGESTSILGDIWATNSKVGFKLGANSIHNRVSDLLQDDGQWNVNLVWNLFDKETSRQVLAIHRSETVGGDAPVWNHTIAGIYSTKSDYRFLRFSEDNTMAEGNFWKVLWKLKIIPSWLIFSWKLINEAFPSCTGLKRRGMDVDESCRL